MENLLGTSIVCQIGILCNDIVATAEAYKQVLGADYTVSETAPYEQSHTTFNGAPTPARIKQAFFDVGPNINIELIEPDHNPSAWRSYLDEHGECVHHIAFWVKDMNGVISLSLIHIYLLLTELLAQLMAISEDVFEPVKREFMAHDNPLMELEPRLATVQQRRAASDWLLSELERTNADIVFDRAPLLREALDRTTTRFVAVTDELLERFIHCLLYTSRCV